MVKRTDMKKLITLLTVVAALAACDKAYDPADVPGAFEGRRDGGEAMAADGDYGDPSDPGGEGNGQQGQAGIVTAGEWNDLDNWPFWGALMTSVSDEQTTGYSQYSGDWKFWTNRRVAVLVKNDNGQPEPGVKVELRAGSEKIWSAVTDVFGRADCWVGLYDPQYQDGGLSLALDESVMPEAPAVTTWEDEDVAMNEYVHNRMGSLSSNAQILFIVDATGSMQDEIDFLKEDLVNILQQVVPKKDNKIATGALFYRDEGDRYVTKTSDFADDYNKTVNFIKKQYAEGGGDYPEAVHTALEVSLQHFKWDASARTRLAFMLLDAPPHINHEGVIESLQKSIELYAAQGIKLIPVASSGVDKSTEFCLRFFAISTGGTYVFLTNDSGVGNDHIIPTVGKYKVEQLNDLMVRLILKYLG